MSEPLQHQGGQGAPSPSELVEEGRALHRAGDLDAAEHRYRKALALDENFADAHQLVAVIAGQRGRFDEAIAGFRRTIALEGPTPERLYNLAEAYRLAGDFTSALASYNQVLTIDAGFLDAYRSCAAAAKEAADRAAASGNADAGKRLRELAAHYLVGLGHVHVRAQSLVEAEKAYRDSIALDPDKAEPYQALGMVALQSHRPVAAEALCRRALALEPRSPTYLNSHGLTLLNLVRTDEAAAVFRQAIEIDPSFEDARLNLEERMLNWLHFRADQSPKAVFAAHRDWARAATERVMQGVGRPPAATNSRDPERPLKIAYVAVETECRLTEHCFLPLIANHDPAAVELFVYVSEGRIDARTRRFNERAQWRKMGPIRSQDTARTLRSNGIDIAIDIAGHLHRGQPDVLAYKATPLTVSWLGYPDTTGLSTVDYRITDEVADPRGAEELYTERLYRMPRGSIVYRPPEQAPEVAALPARAPGAVTLGAFEDARKFAPPVIQAWSSILKSLPKARLLLLAPEFADGGFVSQLQANFRAGGIEPARVEMRRAPEGPDEILAAYSEVDIGLDPFPYNGDITTTCEALWMGVPVVALSGDRTCTRVSAGLLAQVGLERLICDDADDYVATAVQLAEDLDRLRTLRSGMRDRMRVSPLMDERGFARRFEAALRDMWRHWCKSAP